MHDFRARAAAGLQAGDSFVTSRVFTAEDVTRFAEISGDYHPIHFDARYAQARNLREPICHGLLSASLVTEIGGQIAWLASGMNFRFKCPVYVGERITCSMVITAVDANGRAMAQAAMTREDGVTVLEADISGIVPGVEERKVLDRMLSEGDPTNRLARLKSGGDVT